MQGKLVVLCLESLPEGVALISPTLTLTAAFKNELFPIVSGLMMKCSCMNSATSYERLPHVSTYLELDSIYSGDSDDKDSSTEKQVSCVLAFSQ